MRRSYWRGHPIVWEVPGTIGRWVFEDTKEPIPGYGGEIRECAKCRRVFEGSNIGDADPCLGNLPGVDNACCGHGVPELAYIRFTNGTVIKNFTVEEE